MSYSGTGDGYRGAGRSYRGLGGDPAPPPDDETEGPATMAAEDRPAPSPRSRNALEAMLASVWFERALWLVSAVFLLTALWLWADGRLYQWRHRDLLEQDTENAYATFSDAYPAEHRQPIDLGTPIASIEIDRLGLSAIIAEGATSEVLRKAVGHLSSSARPGEPGNVALAAHRDTFFRPLEDVQPGDRVRLRDGNGEATYTVEWTRIVEPSDTTVVAPTDYPALTLITCYPFRFIGNAPQRFIVRARREVPAPRTAGSTEATPITVAKLD